MRNRKRKTAEEACLLLLERQPGSDRGENYCVVKGRGRRAIRQVVVVKVDNAASRWISLGRVDVENGCYASDYRLVVGWGSRSGKCVSSESPCLHGAVRGRSLVGASPG